MASRDGKGAIDADAEIWNPGGLGGARKAGATRARDVGGVALGWAASESRAGPGSVVYPPGV